MMYYAGRNTGTRFSAKKNFSRSLNLPKKNLNNDEKLPKISASTTISQYTGEHRPCNGYRRDGASTADAAVISFAIGAALLRSNGTISLFQICIYSYT